MPPATPKTYATEWGGVGEHGLKTAVATDGEASVMNSYDLRMF